MNDTEHLCNEEESHETEAQQVMSRRDYLLSLKKWSKVVIGSVLVGGVLAVTSQNADADGGWVNRRGGGGWGNGGGNSWANRRGLGAWIDG